MAYNETYMTRAWCRVEILNAFAFCSCTCTHANDKIYIRNGKGFRRYCASDWVVPPIIVVKERFEYASGKVYQEKASLWRSLTQTRSTDKCYCPRCHRLAHELRDQQPLLYMDSRVVEFSCVERAVANFLA
jgi:hypothetical protein